MKHADTIRAAIAALLALGTLNATDVQAAETKQEKCFGTAKAGQNDCATSKTPHSCAGSSKLDNDPKTSSTCRPVHAKRSEAQRSRVAKRPSSGGIAALTVGSGMRARFA